LPRYIFGASVHRPVSCYAFFKGWLLLSQPPGCRSTDTSFSTERSLGDLSKWSGLLPSRRWHFAVTVSLPSPLRQVFGVWLDLVGRGDPRIQTVALPPAVRDEAAPKGISKRTSYLRVRLAFHSYPQVIQRSCDTNWFGPPVTFRSPSPCSWIAHPVSGLVPATKSPYSDSLSLRLRVLIP
jgi:hypothetical protein